MVGKSKSINTLFKSKDGLVYGSLLLKLGPNNTVTEKSGSDDYNFEMHDWLDEPMRNVYTIIGRVVNFGEGDAYKIYFYGEGQLGVKETR